MNRAKLLLVEDDPALLELLEYRFSNEGYNVRATADGDEALILAAEDTPDLVILDASLFLPGTPRDPRAEFEAAHIPGAAYMDFYLYIYVAYQLCKLGLYQY